MAKKTPENNSSSTADIAFLLLCYFLMTTTMGDQSGLQRRLPPIPDSKQAQVSASLIHPWQLRRPIRFRVPVRSSWSRC